MMFALQLAVGHAWTSHLKESIPEVTLLQAMKPTTPPLTFGIELEFIIQYRLSEYPSLHPFIPQRHLTNTHPSSSSHSQSPSSKAKLTIAAASLTYHARRAVGEHVLSVLRNNAGLEAYDLYETDDGEGGDARYERWTLTQDGSIQTPAPSWTPPPWTVAGLSDDGSFYSDTPPPPPPPHREDERYGLDESLYPTVDDPPRYLGDRADVPVDILRHEDDWASLGFELISPVMEYSSTSWPLLVRHLLSHLTAAFPDGRIYCNRSTGLHVHVGCRRRPQARHHHHHHHYPSRHRPSPERERGSSGGGGFDRQTLLNLAQVLLVFEPQLHSLHPAHRLRNVWAPRLSAAPAFRAIQAQPLEQCLVLERACSPTALHPTPHGDESDADPEPDPDSTPINALIRLLNPHGKNHAYFFGHHHLHDPSCSLSGSKRRSSTHRSLRTVEFRQHEGTLHPDRIIAWIDLCIGLVKFACVAGHVTLLQALMVGGFHQGRHVDLDLDLNAGDKLQGRAGPGHDQTSQMNSKGVVANREQGTRREDGDGDGDGVAFDIFDLLRLAGREWLVGFYGDRVWVHPSSVDQGDVGQDWEGWDEEEYHDADSPSSGSGSSGSPPTEAYLS